MPQLDVVPLTIDLAAVVQPSVVTLSGTFWPKRAQTESRIHGD